MFVFIYKFYLLVVVCKVLISIGPVSSLTSAATLFPSTYCILVTPALCTHTWFRDVQALFSVSSKSCKANAVPIPIYARMLLSNENLPGVSRWKLVCPPLLTDALSLSLAGFSHTLTVSHTI